jgi:hypothetical protein
MKHTKVYCHPERKYFANGLCRPCYTAQVYEMGKSDPEYRQKREEYSQKYLEENREEIYSKNRIRAREVKIEVLTHYSLKGYLSCSCPKCDIIEPDFLTIDHINGGGERHRKSLGVGGSFYYWLKRNNFPPGFQTLCMNCNHATGRSFRNKDVCPHLRLPSQ